MKEFLLAALFVLPLTACSSSSIDETKSTGPAPGPDTNVPACDDGVASATVPCSKDPDPCGLNSGFPGDEYCIPPPPEGKGIQIHFGPNDYTDAAEVAKYLIRPGEEFNAYGVDAHPDRCRPLVQLRADPNAARVASPDQHRRSGGKHRRRLSPRRQWLPRHSDRRLCRAHRT